MYESDSWKGLIYDLRISEALCTRHLQGVYVVVEIFMGVSCTYFCLRDTCFEYAHDGAIFKCKTITCPHKCIVKRRIYT